MELSKEKVEQIVKALGGEIEPASDTGHGRTYRFTNPHVRKIFIPHKLSSQLLRKILDDEGLDISEGKWISVIVNVFNEKQLTIN